MDETILKSATTTIYSKLSPYTKDPVLEQMRQNDDVLKLEKMVEVRREFESTKLCRLLPHSGLTFCIFTPVTF